VEAVFAQSREYVVGGPALFGQRPGSDLDDQLGVGA
jgi:hypothetical protein